jgi:hypothetical protein
VSKTKLKGEKNDEATVLGQESSAEICNKNGVKNKRTPNF